MNRNASITIVLVSVILVAGIIGAVFLNNHFENQRAAQTAATEKQKTDQAAAAEKKKSDERKTQLEACLTLASFEYSKDPTYDVKTAEDTCYSRFPQN